MRATRWQVLSILLVCLGVAGVLWGYLWLLHGLPVPEDFGVYVAQTGNAVHVPVPFSDIPEAMRWAAVAAKDSSFYTRPWDLDVRVISRALWYTMQGRTVTSDGVTIPQLLAVNLMLASQGSGDGTLRQRMRELVLVILITQRYTRDEVLGYYLNSVYYGHEIYGVEAAARFYYDKPVHDLSLAECAMLQHVSRIPDYDPLGDPTKARQGQMGVLALMVEAGYISAEEANRASKEQVVFAHE
jgi:membrane carboxypeptidase/penicillin-binding protein